MQKIPGGLDRCSQQNVEVQVVLGIKAVVEGLRHSRMPGKRLPTGAKEHADERMFLKYEQEHAFFVCPRCKTSVSANAAEKLGTAFCSGNYISVRWEISE